MTGKSLLHYRIGQRLGAGGMGEVYAAEDTKLARQVALKFLPASFQYDPERRARFMNEARAASGLRSPNIAAIYDIVEHEGETFIVMEYVEGRTISELVSLGPIEVSKAVGIAMQIADGLDEARVRGIVHRDIKSGNLIVNDRGLVKILDFGLAKFVEEKFKEPSSDDPTISMRHETAVGTVLGTAHYMSPEQALGRPADHRSDIFSTGVVMYEMLTGRLPFEGSGPTEVIDRILHDEPPALARFNYSVPPELERMVRKALEKDSSFRYQTARELYIDLRTLQRDLDSGSRSRDTSKRLTEHQPTQLLADSTPSGGLAPVPARRSNAVAVMTFQNITKEPSDDWIGTGIAETVTGDLKSINGLSVIGRERIFETLKNLASGELAELDEKFSIDIGRRLGAAWTVGGGYQRMGEMIRITARFMDVETGTLIKTVKIDGEISKIFELQDRIVYELSQGLNLQLGDSEITEIERYETKSVEAYEDYSRGMMNLRLGSRDSLDRAIYLFEKAIERDANYASAWAALGAAYDLKGSFLTLRDLSYKAIECEKKAISLNPKLSRAHQWLGAAYNSIGHYDEAITNFKRALELDPGAAGAHASLARAYWIGKGMIGEGIKELEHAVEINPEAGWAYLQLALLYTIRGNYERAEAVSRKAVELQELYVSGREGLQIIGAHARLGYAYYCQGRYDEAIEEYDRELQFLSTSDHALRDRALIEANQKIGAAYIRNGMAQEAERHFKAALKGFEARVAKGADDPFTKYYIACLYALKGEPEKALKYLEETFVELRALNTLRAKIEPDLESVRQLPRFKEIIEER